MSGLQLTVGLLCALPMCLNAQVLTENQVLTLFDQQTPLQREARATAAAAVEEVRGRTLWPNPVATYSRETVGFTEFVQAQQQFPWSGRLGYTKLAMDPARETAEAQGSAQIWQARTTVRQALYRALAAQRQAKILRDGIAEFTRVIELLRIREQEGEGARYDVLRVEREISGMRADLALVEARANAERAVLLAYLPAQTSMDSLEGELRPQSVLETREIVLNRALDARSELRAQSSQLTLLAFEEQAADRLRIPEPVVTAGMKRTTVGTRTVTGAVVGVSFTLPTFNKGKTEVARLAAEQDRVSAQRDVLRQQIAAAVTSAYEAYMGQLQALQVFERETLDSGRELVIIARVGYEEGELGILELLDALRVARQTSLRQLELETTVRESEIELSRNAGYAVTQ